MGRRLSVYSGNCVYSLGIHREASEYGCRLSPDRALRLTPHPNRSLVINSLKYKLSPDPDHNRDPGHRLNSLALTIVLD